MSAPVPAAAHQERAIWWAALVCFVFAASTGAFLRFGMLRGLPWGLDFTNVRHAHSHLMFFSWVTPLLMAFAATLYGSQKHRRRGLRVAWLALTTGVLTYLPFLLSGYGRLELFGRELPLSMMTAGLTGIGWYAFVAFHFTSSRGSRRTLPLRALDGAALSLLFAALAVTAVPVVIAAGLGTAWRDGLIDVFLESFGEGWFAIALLALAYAQLARRDDGRAARSPTSGGGPWEHLGVILLTAGLISRSLARLAVATGGAWAQPPAFVAAVAASAGMLLLVVPLIRLVFSTRTAPQRRLWLLPLLFLLLKALADPLLSVPALAHLLAGGTRILLLHAFLLGAVSLGLMALVRERLGREQTLGAGAFAVSVMVLLAGLTPLTPLWPAASSGPWVLATAAWTSLGPPAAALFMLSAGACLAHGSPRGAFRLTARRGALLPGDAGGRDGHRSDG